MLEILKETFDGELEGIKAVYCEEDVIAQECTITTCPKHVLSREPPPKPKLMEIVV